MLWSLLDHSSEGSFSCWLASDIFYVGSLILLGSGLWCNFRKKDSGWLCLLFGWIMVMQSFSIRVIAVLLISGNAHAETIAVGRSVLHTLVLPLLVVFVWAVFRLIRDQFTGCRKLWLTGLGLVWIIFAAWGCGCISYRMYKCFGSYNSPIWGSQYHGEHEGFP